LIILVGLRLRCTFLDTGYTFLDNLDMLLA